MEGFHTSILADTSLVISVIASQIPRFLLCGTLAVNIPMSLWDRDHAALLWLRQAQSEKKMTERRVYGISPSMVGAGALSVQESSHESMLGRNWRSSLGGPA